MELAPAVLDHDALVKVIAIFTGKYTKAIKPINPVKLIFRSFAVIDRLEGIGAGETKTEAIIAGNKGDDKVDSPSSWDEDEDSDDELTMAALDSLDALDVFGHGEKPKSQAYIPEDNLRRIIMLTLLISPLEPQQPLATFADRMTGDALEELRETAENILSAFKITEGKGVLYHDFRRTMVNSTVSRPSPLPIAETNNISPTSSPASRPSLSTSSSAPTSTPPTPQKSSPNKPPRLSSPPPARSSTSTSSLNFPCLYPVIISSIVFVFFTPARMLAFLWELWKRVRLDGGLLHCS